MRGIVLLVVGARIEPTLLLDLKRLGRFLFDFKFPRGTFNSSLRSFGESLKELNFWLLLFLEKSDCFVSKTGSILILYSLLELRSSD